MKGVFKKAISTLLALTMLCSLVVVPATATGSSSGITVNLEFHDGSWSGRTYTTKVCVVSNQAFNVNTIEFQVAYDSEVLTCTTATKAFSEGSADPSLEVAGKVIFSEGLGTKKIPATENGGKYEVHIMDLTFEVADENVERQVTSLTFEATDTDTLEVADISDGYQPLNHTVDTKQADVDVEPGITPKLTTAKLYNAEGTELNLNTPFTVTGGESKIEVKAKVFSAKGTDITEWVDAIFSDIRYIHSLAREGGFYRFEIVGNAPADEYEIGFYSMSQSNAQGRLPVKITVNRDQSEVQSIAIYQGDTALGESANIAIPASGESTYNYTVKGMNQYGEVVDVTGVNWTIDPSNDGNVILNNGTVTVKAGAGEKAFTLKAEVDGKTASVILNTKKITFALNNFTWESTPIYGMTWGDILTGEITGTAKVGETEIPGDFILTNGDEVPSAGKHTQTFSIVFNATASDSSYKNIPVPFSTEITIGKKPLNATLGDLTKEYSGQPQKPTLTFASGDLVPGDSAPSFTITVTDSQSPASTTGVTAVGTYTATAALDDATNSNYRLVVSPQDFVITPKSVTVTGITAANKVYDGNTDAAISGGTVDGAVSGDTVTVTLPAKGSFNNKNVGTGKTVTIRGITLGGASAGNYTLSSNSATATADITAKPITGITGITAADKTYDGNTNATLNISKAAITGMVEGDNLTVASAAGTFADKNVGTDKTVTVSGVTLGGTDKDNYSFTPSSMTATADITAKGLTVNDGTFKVTKEYDGKVDAGTASGELGLTGVVSGDTVYVARKAGADPAVSNVTVGAYAEGATAVGKGKTVELTGITLDGTDKNNYTVAGTYEFKHAEITKLLPKKDMLKFELPATNPVYSGNAVAIEVTPKTAYSDLGKITVKYALEKADGTFETAAATAPKNAGTYQVSVSVADSTNYGATPEDIVLGTFTIDKAERNLAFKEGTTGTLTLKAKNATGTLEFVCSDEDTSAKYTYELTGPSSAVSRTNNTFTALGNGKVSAKITIADTTNYKPANITATIISITDPVGSIAVTGADAGDQLTAKVDGNKIVVSGLAKSAEAKPTVSVTPATIGDGVTLTVATDADTGAITISLGDDEIATYTVDTTGITAMPTMEDADVTIKGDAVPEVPEGTAEDDKIKAADVDNLTASTAKDLPKATEEAAVKTAVEEASKDLAEGKKPTVEVTITLKVKQVETKKNEANTNIQSIKLDIKPVYTVEVKVDSDVKSTPINGADYTGGFSSPVTIKVTLPDGFVPKYAKHHLGGTRYEYLAVSYNSTSKVASWQQSSFSEVELLAVSYEGTITLDYGDKQEQKPYTLENVDDPLPVLQKDGYTFKGWTTGASGETPYGKITEDLLKKMDAAGGKNLTLTPVFTENEKPVTPVDPTPTPTPGGSTGSSSGGGSSSGSSGKTTVATTGSVKNGSIHFSATDAKEGDTVTITARPKKGYEVDEIIVRDKNGDIVRVREGSRENTFTFVMPAGKVTVEAVFVKSGTASQPSTNPFYDVSESAYYYDAVLWALENDITGGTSATTFAPGAACTRAQTVTFLWRAAGCPAPQSTVNPFTDLNPGSYYYDAVLWAVEQGITNGLSATSFGPGATVNRAQVVTFLYRSAKAGAEAAGSAFNDVAADAYYAGPVQWAVANGITNGTTATTFGPANPCTRGQIVTFLYRHFV